MKDFVNHPFPPVYDSNSRLLILGTFPSQKSRDSSFYYAHPQNRFWKLMAAILKEDLPMSVPDKISMLQKHGIALWDTVKSCEIKLSSDASIGKVIPNDISSLIKRTNISCICCNGKKAYELYKKHIEQNTGIPAISLPSTSPANASYSLDMLICSYSAVIKPVIE